jgi:hypothetical protein
VNPASAGRRAIARPDPEGDWTARCIVTSAESRLAIVTIASTVGERPLLAGVLLDLTGVRSTRGRWA